MALREAGLGERKGGGGAAYTSWLSDLLQMRLEFGGLGYGKAGRGGGGGGEYGGGRTGRAQGGEAELLIPGSMTCCR